MPEVCELTKPLFAIPTHQFMFNPGSIDAKAFIDTLQLEPSEYELIKYPERGTMSVTDAEMRGISCR